MNALRRFVCVFVVAALPCFARPAQASPICCDPDAALPLVQQFDKADIVLFGHFKNARPSNNGLDQGTTDFVIERTYKEHPLIKGKKELTLPKYITDSKTKFIIFGEVYMGKLDFYKGTPLVDGSEMVKYIEGSLHLKAKSQAERLRYAFDFLNSPEFEVSTDAYREFARSDYRDYKELAKKLDADKIAGWLKDPKTPPYRYGLYSMLLGHCGNAKHADLLMGMINEAEKNKSSGVHGLMMGYILIEPEKGWTYLKNLVQNKKHPFLMRYAGLNTVRFLYEWRHDLVNKDEAAAKKEVVSGVMGVLNVDDMADFAVEDLRKWKRWECTDQVLGMFGRKELNSPIIRKSILRFALQCPNPAAKSFVAEQRKRDAEWVSDTEELLNLETTPAASTPTSK